MEMEMEMKADENDINEKMDKTEAERGQEGEELEEEELQLQHASTPPPIEGSYNWQCQTCHVSADIRRSLSTIYSGQWSRDDEQSTTCYRDGYGQLNVNEKWILESGEKDAEEANNEMTYTGQWADGMPHGIGLLRWSDTSYYAGEMMWGWPHGVGVFQWTVPSNATADRRSLKMSSSNCLIIGRYEGEFRTGNAYGAGLVTFSPVASDEGDEKREDLGPEVVKDIAEEADKGDKVLFSVLGFNEDCIFSKLIRNENKCDKLEESESEPDDADRSIKAECNSAIELARKVERQALSLLL